MDGGSADFSQPQPFQAGEIIYHNGGDMLKVSGFRNDTATLSDGQTLHRTSVAVNYLDNDGKTTKSDEIAVYDSRAVQTDPAAAQYLKRQIGEILDARDYFKTLPPERQKTLLDAYAKDVGASVPDGEMRASLNLSQAYLKQLQQEAAFNKAKSATTPPVAVEPLSPTEKEPRPVKLFKTEKGSVYTRDTEGKYARHKTVADKDYEPMDMTVFLDLTPAQDRMILDSVYAESSPTKPRTYIVERQSDNSALAIESIDQIKDPTMLYVVIIRTVNGVSTMLQNVHCTLEPAVGKSVYEERHFENAHNEPIHDRHLGHKVTEIEYA